MKLRDYDYIIAIAEEQSISKAANRLYITQPALSRMLQTVEAEIGSPLFQRTGKILVPTDAGRIYLDAARKILDTSADMERKLREQSAAAQGLDIAAPLSYFDFLNTSVFPAFHREHPDVCITSASIAQRMVLDHLLQRKLTVVMAMADDECRAQLSCAPIGNVELILAVPVGHPLLDQAEERVGYTYPMVTPEKLADCTFVMPSAESYSGHFALTYFAANSINPKISLTVPRTAMLPELVRMGLGVAIMSSLCMRGIDNRQSLRCLSLRPSKEARMLSLMCRKDHILTPLENDLLTIARENFA